MVAMTTEEPRSAPDRRAVLNITGLVFGQDDREILQRLFREFDAIDDEQNALGVSCLEKAADEGGAEQRFAGTGCHFKQEFAAAFHVERPGDGIQRVDLVSPQEQIVLEGCQIIRSDNFAAERSRRLQVL